VTSAHGNDGPDARRPRHGILDASDEELQWLDELRMKSDLIIAAARSPDSLQQKDIDRILGLES
jgi:hypothetical protein